MIIKPLKRCQRIIDGQIMTVQWQYRKCGKSTCSKCQAGERHGPYFYGYGYVDGKLKSFYIGKTLPEGSTP